MPRQHKTVDTIEDLKAVAKEVDARPYGTVLAHSRVEADQRFEEGQERRRLDPDLTWIHLGFAYVMIGIDRSLFEVFNAAAPAGEQLTVKTVTTPGPVASVIGAEYHRNPWSRMVQGIPADKARAFIDFVASYRFDRKATGVTYWCNFQEVTCADPTEPEASPLIKVPIWFALPARRERGLAWAGAQLNPVAPPLFGMTRRQA